VLIVLQCQRSMVQRPDGHRRGVTRTRLPSAASLPCTEHVVHACIAPGCYWWFQRMSCCVSSYKHAFCNIVHIVCWSCLKICVLCLEKNGALRLIWHNSTTFTNYFWHRETLFHSQFNKSLNWLRTSCMVSIATVVTWRSVWKNWTIRYFDITRLEVL